MKYSEITRVHLPFLLATFFVWGCSEAPDEGSALASLNESYDAAMEQTRAAAVVFPVGSSAEVEMLESFQDYFRNMTAETVIEKTSRIYAPDAYLNDNVVGIFGQENIESYFVHAAGQVDVMDVRFLDVARSETDYYIRWKMTIRADALAKGETIESYGTTQFRVNEEGQVLVHRDFWDAATGMYEHLPYVGGMFSFVHEKLGAGAEEQH